MTTAVIREKLHQYIDIADEKKLEAIYTMMDELEHDQFLKTDKMVLMQQAASDKLFLADLKEVKDDFNILDNEI
jgi:hypothetical protein